jgi:hypothetical protein
MTLGNAAAGRVRLIVWCKACQHQGEPDPAEMAARYGAGTIGASRRGADNPMLAASFHGILAPLGQAEGRAALPGSNGSGLPEGPDRRSRK